MFLLLLVSLLLLAFPELLAVLLLLSTLLFLAFLQLLTFLLSLASLPFLAFLLPADPGVPILSGVQYHKIC
jgi:hypothetical protein